MATDIETHESLAAYEEAQKDMGQSAEEKALMEKFKGVNEMYPDGGGAHAPEHPGQERFGHRLERLSHRLGYRPAGEWEVLLLK